MITTISQGYIRLWHEKVWCVTLQYGEFSLQALLDVSIATCECKKGVQEQKSP